MIALCCVFLVCVCLSCVSSLAAHSIWYAQYAMFPLYRCITFIIAKVWNNLIHDLVSAPNIVILR